MKKIVLLLLAIITSLLVLTVGAIYYLVNQPNYSHPQKVKIVVTKGETVDQIATKLEKKGLIYHQLLFKLAVRQAGVANKLKAGSFTLDGLLSPKEIAVLLTQRPEDTWIKLLEGWRREEMADYLSKQTDLTAFEREKFLNLTQDKEGYLFPDSYLVPKEITNQALVNLLTRTFAKKVNQGLATEIASSPHSLKQAVIVASLLEREAKGYQQMRLVAGIIYNRLKLGMPLQIDATLQYAHGWDPTTQSYWSPPSPSFKKLVSPYNTYLNPGLPPTPIANPGVVSIKAALQPLDTKDLYYLHAPDGRIYSARNLNQHNQNINKYLQ